MSSWLLIPPGSHFSLANIPFGVVSTAGDTTRRCATRLGDTIVGLSAFASNGGFDSLPSFRPHTTVFDSPTLNDFAALGRQIHDAVRHYLQEIFRSPSAHPQILQDNPSLQKLCVHPISPTEPESSQVTMHLPLRIGDYTDFYAGIHHARNVGTLFRGKEHALQDNYLHMPIGYHGRASSIIVSGTPVRRPNGQILLAPPNDDAPSLLPTRKLDFELELACFISRPSSSPDQGQCTGQGQAHPIPLAQAREHIFGYALLNDWSARDVQQWEYRPLGPFAGKNFATTVGGWVVLAGALEGFMVDGPVEEGQVLLPYLRGERKRLDIRLEVGIVPKGGQETVVTQTNACELLYSFEQMIAHHTVGGCGLCTGDMLGSGTISGAGNGEMGSLLEMTKDGKESVDLGDAGVMRTWLEDGDEVILRGWAGKAEDGLVGFGECRGVVLEALKIN